MAIPCPTRQLRITGIEPISSAWKADGLPLIYIRHSKFRSRRCVPNRPIIGAGLASHAQRLCPAQAPSRMRVMDHSCSIHFIYDNSWNAIASRSYLSDSRAIKPNRRATENCKAEAAGNRATIRPEKQSISTGTAFFEA